MKNKIRKIKKSIVQKFDLAPEAIGCMRLILIDNTDIYLENHKGVIEYTQKSVVISYGQYNLVIKGDDLKLMSFGKENVAVKGKITCIQYEKF